MADEERNDVAPLLALTDNPPDRLWRYPIAGAIVPWLVPTPLTPNQVTVAHTLVGIAAGVLVARGTHGAFLAAAVLCEVRAVLDCLDGALARAKRTTSAFGRSLDQLGDSIAFEALVIGGAWLVIPDLGVLSILTVLSHVLVLAITSGTGSMAWDLHRRRLISLVEQGRDVTEDEFLLLCKAMRTTPGLGYSHFAASYQWLVLAPRRLLAMRDRIAREDWPPESAPPTPLGLQVQADARARHPGLVRAARSTGWVAGDNQLFLISLALVLGWYPGFLPWLGLFGVAIVACNVTILRRYLADAARRATDAPLGGTAWASTRP